MQSYAECHPRILVVGDLMIDHYLWGKAGRISPEAPVPVIDVERESEVLGGAGNVINNLAALGARVEAASVFGADEEGLRLVKMLEDLGVGTEGVILESERRTTRKSRVIASHQQVIRYDSESREEIAPRSEDLLLERIDGILEKGVDLILLSDYAKGVLSERVTQGIITRARERGIRVMVDPKGKEYAKYRGATAITPNKKEASEATGIEIRDEESLRRAGFALKEQLGVERVIITLSEEGMAIFGEEMRLIPTVAKEVYDVTGAGDTVIATLGFVRACGGAIDEAARIANAAAALVVGKLGSATVTWEEILSYEKVLKGQESETKILSRDELARRIGELKAQGKKIVFTNGCFDILHLGHVKYLQEARSYGDVLVVGVNSDASVRRLKGPERPVNPEYDRAYLLAALEAVDYVTVFDEDTPYELIRALAPHILVKGADYRDKEVIGSDLVEEVRLVDLVSERSTSSLIHKIKQGAQ